MILKTMTKLIEITQVDLDHDRNSATFTLYQTGFVADDFFSGLKTFK